MLVTPFLDSGALDLPGLVDQTEFAIRLGATGLALFGLAGEGFKLSEAERESLLETVVAVNAGRLPVITAVDHAGSLAAAARAERAMALGSAAVMAMPPMVSPEPSPDAILHHFRALEAATAAPIVVQDAPAASNVRLPVDLLRRLTDEVPAIAGIKVEAPPTPPKVVALRKQLDRELILYGGRGGIAHLTELLAGADGTMVGPAYIDVFTAIWRAFATGDTASARRHFTTLLPAIAFAEGNDLYARTQKMMLRDEGVISSDLMRNPTGAMDTVMREEWSRIAAAIPRPTSTPRAPSYRSS
ncbi:dihydrodipicolinate synthase family protein [Kribbella pittospori]|nr:dihydrodipicolinate synthase family protein [Kribbella pittospori]